MTSMPREGRPKWCASSPALKRETVATTRLRRMSEPIITRYHCRKAKL
jgi:hypothetical protein